MLKNNRQAIKKLIFSNIFIIDTPGILTNKACSKFSDIYTKTRVILHFEKLYTDIWLKTQEKLGKKAAEDLMYDISKQIATRYISFIDQKRLTDKLGPKIINHIFKILQIFGMTFAKDIEFRKDGSIIMTGDNCIICRKIGNASLMGGITSGILSTILKKNIEARAECKDCPKNCRIIADPSLPQKYIPDIKDIRVSKGYIKNNFPPHTPHTHTKKLIPLLHLFRFKKVHISDDMKFCYNNKVIFPSEIGLPELIVKNYDAIGKMDLLKGIVINSSEEIISDFIDDKKTVNEKIKEIIGIITAFGWGIPEYKRTENKVIFIFINPPITRFGPHLRSFIINGYLNRALGKRLDIDKVTDWEFHYSF